MLEPTKLTDKVLAERYRRHPGPYRIGRDDLNGIFPGILSIPYDPHQYGVSEYGEINESETELLTHVVKWLESRILVEFGTLYGRSTRIMAEQSPNSARILTVDLPDNERQSRAPIYTTDEVFIRLREHAVGEKYRGSPAATKVIQLRMDATSKEFAESLDELLRGSTIDFALIDAAHDYYTTKTLFEEVALPRMSQDGVIMTDDYGVRSWTHIGVTEFFATKARQDGFLFYHYYPNFGEPVNISKQPSAIVFVNLPQAKNRDWRRLKT